MRRTDSFEKTLMYHSFLIHSSADGHLGCFHVLAIINSAAVNIGVHMSQLGQKESDMTEQLSTKQSPTIIMNLLCEGVFYLPFVQLMIMRL